MRNDSVSITPIQLASISISTIIGVSMLGIPRFVVNGAGMGAPFASLIGVVVAFIGLITLAFLGKRFPKQTVIGYSQALLGKKLGTFFSVLIIITFTLLMGLETRQFAEVVAGALLPNTPIQVAIFFMIFLCATVAFQNVVTFAYIHFFYLPLIILPIAVVLLPSVQDFEIYHLTPILGNDPNLLEFLKGGVIVAQAMLGIFVISMVIPYMKDPVKCLKSSTIGFWIGSVFVVLIITMTLAVFGEEEIQQMFWPTLILGKMVHIPAQILARVDSILLISWIYGVYTTLLSFYFIFVRGVAELIRSEHYRMIACIGFPIMFIIAIFPSDIYTMYDYLLKVTFFGLFIVIVYPLLLLIISIFRKKGEVTL